MKNKLQEKVSSIALKLMNLINKTLGQLKLTSKLCVILKKGYTYYYYLCFKEFINKLLKPKKMIAIKWKSKYDSDFSYFTYVYNEQIKNCSNIIPNNIDTSEAITSFIVQNNDPSIRLDEFELTPQLDYIIIEGGYIHYRDNDMNTFLIDGNPSKFRTNSIEWHDFDYSVFDNEKSIVFMDVINKIFSYEHDKTQPKRWCYCSDDDKLNLKECKYDVFIKEMTNPLLIIK